MADEKKLYFYKCAGEEYSTGHVYFDHANGIAGYEKVQQRANYLGHATIKAFEKSQATRRQEQKSYGRRSEKVNVSRSYNPRY